MNIRDGKLEIKFIASRVYHNIDMTYFFLSNNSVLIKSSFEATHQVRNISQNNPNELNMTMTGYALT
jgi:hypothetical protein